MPRKIKPSTTRLTEKHKEILSECFEECKSWSRRRIEMMANQLGVNETKIVHWYRYQRSILRKRETRTGIKNGE